MKMASRFTAALFTLLFFCSAPAFADGVVDELAIIKTTKGEIVLEFFPDKAPRHVKNWKKLAKEGFYNETYFHRVIPGFMIQGGDPKTKDNNKDNDGTGGSGTKIKAEFNDTKHERGILSMARSGHPDSASSQFFIVVGSARYLDGKYTAFGRVVKGMKVVDSIVASQRNRKDNPLTPIFIESIKFVNRADWKPLK